MPLTTVLNRKTGLPMKVQYFRHPKTGVMVVQRWMPPTETARLTQARANSAAARYASYGMRGLRDGLPPTAWATATWAPKMPNPYPSESKATLARKERYEDIGDDTVQALESMLDVPAPARKWLAKKNPLLAAVPEPEPVGGPPPKARALPSRYQPFSLAGAHGHGKKNPRALNLDTMAPRTI